MSSPLAVLSDLCNVEVNKARAFGEGVVDLLLDLPEV